MEVLLNAQERAKELLENYVKNIGTCVGKQYNIIWEEISDFTSATTQIVVESTAA